jgi:BirA family biotin operon repressor/biotin-[acetyl-CoA-carboxylase] ligase
VVTSLRPDLDVVTSPWSNLDRPPLSERALRAALVRPGGFVRDVHVITATGSTNDDLAEAARRGAGEGVVLVAEEQTRGRGRLDRAWTSPPRAGLLFSVLLRPPVPATRRTWLPLLAGLSVQQAVARLGRLDTRVKWPNDLLLGDDLGKAGGVLAQAAGDAVVVGVGLNVSTRRSELPPGAVSLATEGAECTDRDPLLRAILRTLADRYAEWLAGPDSLRGAYEAVCDTIGREVRVRLPDGRGLAGTATGLDETGRLVVRTAAGEVPVSAGDVTLVRAATSR